MFQSLQTLWLSQPHRHTYFSLGFETIKYCTFMWWGGWSQKTTWAPLPACFSPLYVTDYKSSATWNLQNLHCNDCIGQTGFCAIKIFYRFTHQDLQCRSTLFMLSSNKSAQPFLLISIFVKPLSWGLIHEENLQFLF